MENSKPLSADQLDTLRNTVRQHFDELYRRIGSNRQNLFTKVLLVDQQINKELTKDKIDSDHEKDILRRLREIEKIAGNQLPLFHKVSALPSSPSQPSSSTGAAKVTTPKEVAKAKPEKKDAKAKPAKKETKAKPAKNTAKAKPAKKKKK